MPPSGHASVTCQPLPSKMAANLSSCPTLLAANGIRFRDITTRNRCHPDGNIAFVATEKASNEVKRNNIEAFRFHVSGMREDGNAPF